MTNSQHRFGEGLPRWARRRRREPAAIPLPLAGACLLQCTVDHALWLHFHNGVHLRIEGDVVLRTDGQEHVVDPEGAPADIDLARVLSRATASSGTASHDGRLHLEFQDGMVVDVPSSDIHEAWTLTTEDGMRLVSRPGGGLVVHESLPPAAARLPAKERRVVVEDLLRGAVDPCVTAVLPPPEMDPLTEDGALLEGQVLDVRVEALTSIVAVLIDLRYGLQIRTANTALLVVHGVRNFTWRTSRWKPGSMLAWNIASSLVEERGDGLLVDLDTISNAHLTVVGHSAAFYAGDIAGGWEAPPDYGEIGLNRTHPGLAQWSSPLDLRHATFSSRWTAS